MDKFNSDRRRRFRAALRGELVVIQTRPVKPKHRELPKKRVAR